MASGLLGWLGLLTLFTLLTPAIASAHATLTRSDPAINGGYAEPPAAITLWFSEEVEARYSRVEVFDAAGAPAPAGALASLPGERDPALRLPIEGRLANGAYTVVWSSVSKPDGHPIGGTFGFTVGGANLPSAAEQAALAGRVGRARAVSPVVEGVARWLGLLGQATLAGALVFVPFALAPALGVGTPLPARRPRRLLVGSLAAAGVAQLAAAVFQALNVTDAGFPGAIGRPLITLLADTRFGALWLGRTAAIAALALLVGALTRGAWVVPPRGRGRALWGAAIAMAALLLLITSFGSHAAGLGGASVLPVLNDWLHLAGASVWVGGLAAFVVVTPGVTPVAGVARRFSALALGAIALLVVTGLLAARWQVAAWEGLTGTRYGSWLLLKLAIVAAALGLSAWHLLVARPRLEAGGEARNLWRGLRAETALVVLALAASAALTVAVPARDVLDRGATEFGATRLTPEAVITFRAAPGRIGVNEFSIVIAPVDLTTFGAAQRVYLRFEPRAPDASVGGGQLVLLQQAGPRDPNTFRGVGSYLALKGDWTVTAIVQRAGVPDIEAPFAFTADASGLRPIGIVVPDAGVAGRAVLLGAIWLVIGSTLAGMGWWLRRVRAGLAYGLFALAVFALAIGSVAIAVGSRAG